VKALNVYQNKNRLRDKCSSVGYIIVLLAVHFGSVLVNNQLDAQLFFRIPYLFQGDQDVDGRIILRWIFRKFEGVVGTGWSWLRIGIGGGLLMGTVRNFRVS
jgi:hypothetical protein